jgi:hypothetical protein
MTAASSITGGRPERGRSTSAPIPPASCRLRQARTVGVDTPTCRPIAAFCQAVGGQQHDPRPLHQPGRRR